jgi:hypothetical protein
VRTPKFSQETTPPPNEKIAKALIISGFLRLSRSRDVTLRSIGIGVVVHGEKMSNVTETQHLLDCQTLGATELRKRYSAEANTHRNMKQRARSLGRIIHPDFHRFCDFLAHVGPRLCLGATLDRIDNNDPEYAPGKVRWADKRTQNSNKGDTLLFSHSRTNETYTVSQLAKRQNKSPATIRKHLERGWDDDEIIEGKRRRVQSVNSPTLPSHRPRKYPRANSILHKGSRDARDIMRDRRNASVAHHRAEYGEEYCLCDYETLAEISMEVGVPINRSDYERKFTKWWAEWKPYLAWMDLPAWAQELIARTEGTTLAEINCRLDEMRDQL